MPSVPGVILLADEFAHNVARNLMGREGKIRWWRPGDPDDEDARHDWTMLVAYMDEREKHVAAWNRRAGEEAR